MHLKLGSHLRRPPPSLLDTSVRSLEAQLAPAAYCSSILPDRHSSSNRGRGLFQSMVRSALPNSLLSLSYAWRVF